MSGSTLNKEATRAINYKQLKVTSPVFKENEMIPAKYTCDGVNVSIPLDIKHIPEEAKCLASGKINENLRWYYFQEKLKDLTKDL